MSELTRKTPLVVSFYGFYGIDNVGNEAMLQAMMSPLKDAFGDQVSFQVFSRHPSSAFDEQYDCVTVPNLEHPTRESSEGRWLRGVNPDDGSDMAAFVENIAKSDLVILGPGQYLVETGARGLFKGALAQAAVLSQVCRLTDTPLYGAALACEPIATGWSSMTIEDILSVMVHVNFRDPVSPENIQAAGIPLENPEVLGDMALSSLPHDPQNYLSEIAALDVPEKRGPRLAVAHRNLYFMDNKDEVEAAYAQAIRSWLAHDDRDVLFIPQGSYHVDNDRDDDRIAARRFVEKYELPLDRICLVETETRPDVIEVLYSLCDVTLASRLHGSVFSCRQSVPPVVLNCLKKMQGYYQRLGLSELLIEPDAGAKEIAQKLESNLNNKQALQQKIQQQVELNRQTSGGYMQRAIELLETYSESERKVRVRQRLQTVGVGL